MTNLKLSTIHLTIIKEHPPMNTKKNTQKNQKLTNITKSCIFQQIQLKITPIIIKYHSNIYLAADWESGKKSIICLVKEYPIHLIFDHLSCYYFVNVFCYLVGNFVGWLCGWWWDFWLIFMLGFIHHIFIIYPWKYPWRSCRYFI